MTKSKLSVAEEKPTNTYVKRRQVRQIKASRVEIHVIEKHNDSLFFFLISAQSGNT